MTVAAATIAAMTISSPVRSVRWLRAALTLTSAVAACDPRDKAEPKPGPTPSVPTSSRHDDVPELDPISAPAPTDVSDATTAAVVEGFNAFAFDLYAKIATEDGNEVYSPASMALALTMLHAGAQGETAAEIAAAMHQSGPTAQLQSVVRNALARYNGAHPDYELTVVNRLFGDRTVPFEAAYLDLSQRMFAAPLEAMDFARAPEPSRVRINDWVAAQTRGRIKDLMPPNSVQTDTRLLLANAIHFKANWAAPFAPHLTKAGVFHGPSGDVQVSMMHRLEHMRYGASAYDNMAWVELPYAGGDLAMVILLPDVKMELAALERRLSASTLASWLATGEHLRVDLSLPRFTIDMRDPVGLAGPLRALGITRAFDFQLADFTGIGPANARLQLSAGYHKAYIAVDEDGTEAAASTALLALEASAEPPAEPVMFTVDRPFVYLVREVRTGLLLFLGRVTLPMQP